ncbi:uncharacterized protein C8Q71DRAFT_819284 [Rhodofomes roseus]|uniref:Uncharacterized protein n=1 Tax=Rhodofomes roseus TaxID=34475 RepID=A0ABQ8JYG3_9APHY|nr:uncharacterized protein C8Q71DRAFT_819284 [Rhodofomes roseus]KAH9828624.1 hypothetical protein C8Q71DRAFT_819284 [Rhodofomes roseus]
MRLQHTKPPQRRSLWPGLILPKKRIKRKTTYGTRFTRARGEIRQLLTKQLQSISGKETAAMKWTAESFYTHVAKEYAVCLDGWPQHLVFANLSDVPGGIAMLQDLLSRIHRGVLVFTKLSEDEHKALTVQSAAPGKFTPRPPRAQRRDYGVQRVPPWLRLSRPPRKVCVGPKSSEYVEDSDAYDSEVEEIESVAGVADDGGLSEIESASGFDD